MHSPTVRILSGLGCYMLPPLLTSPCSLGHGGVSVPGRSWPVKSWLAIELPEHVINQALLIVTCVTGSTSLGVQPTSQLCDPKQDTGLSALVSSSFKHRI